MSAVTTEVTPTTATGTLIEVRDLEVHFALHGTFRSRLTGHGGGSVKAVDGVSFDLREGEVLGLVGESGSGKTTLGRALLGLVRPTGGSVKLRGRELAGLPEKELRPLRRHLQMVFQDPHASLNPAMNLETAIAHPLQIHGMTKSARGDAREGARDAGSRRALARGRLRGALPGRPLGRAEAARGDRALDHRRPGAAGRRRARLDARHERAGEDPRPDDRPQEAARADVRLRHARPRVREVLLRPRGDHVPRPDRRDRYDRDRSSPTPSTPTRRRCSRRSRSRTRTRRSRATCRAARSPTPPARRSAARSTRAARSRSSRAAGRAATCARCWRSAGWRRARRPTPPSARWSATWRRSRPRSPTRCSSRPAAGRDPGALLTLLEKIRSEMPDEPFWRGVKSMAAETHGVRVAFEPGHRSAALRRGRHARRMPALPA